MLLKIVKFLKKVKMSIKNILFLIAFISCKSYIKIFI